MICTKAAAAIAAMVGVVACSRSGPPLPSNAPAAPAAIEPAAIDPAKHEMQLLEAAMHATLRGIASGDVRAVPAAFAEVDRAKESTEAALEHGTYRPPRNGDRLARFRELDEAFHAGLERIPAAAARGDVAATADAFGAAMRGCPTCHAEFRP